MSYIQHFVGFLLCMCVSVLCDRLLIAGVRQPLLLVTVGAQSAHVWIHQCYSGSVGTEN